MVHWSLAETTAETTIKESAVAGKEQNQQATTNQRWICFFSGVSWSQFLPENGLRERISGDKEIISLGLEEEFAGDKSISLGLEEERAGEGKEVRVSPY